MANTFPSNCKPSSLQILSVLNEKDASHIISWTPDGRAFIIQDKTKFCSEILPNHFNNVKYPSFTRNMKRWGFVAMNTRQGSKPSFCHPLFVRDDIESCRKTRSSTAPPSLDGSSDSGNAEGMLRLPQQEMCPLKVGAAALPNNTNSQESMPSLPQEQMINDVTNNIDANQQYQQQDTGTFVSQELHQQIQAHYQASLQQAVDSVLSNARNSAAVNRGELMANASNGNLQMNNHSSSSLQGSSRSITSGEFHSLNPENVLLHNALHSILRQR